MKWVLPAVGLPAILRMALQRCTGIANRLRALARAACIAYFDMYNVFVVVSKVKLCLLALSPASLRMRPNAVRQR